MMDDGGKFAAKSSAAYHPVVATDFVQVMKKIIQIYYKDVIFNSYLDF